MSYSGITRGTCSLIWSATLGFAEGVEPFDFITNGAGHLVVLACGAVPATDWAIFHLKAQVDMMLKLEQLLFGVQVDILVFPADGTTDPRVNCQHFESSGSPFDWRTYTLVESGSC